MRFLMSTGAKEVKNHHNQIHRELVEVLPRLPLNLHYRASSVPHAPLRAHQLVSPKKSFLPSPLGLCITPLGEGLLLQCPIINHYVSSECLRGTKHSASLWGFSYE